MFITKRVEFDAGHRIPDHNSKCRNFHGHRYALEVTLAGDINPVRGESDDGMVMDFGDIKRIMNSEIADVWDHSFLVYSEDHDAIAALKSVDSKHIVLDVIPTVENLASVIFTVLDMSFAKAFKPSWGKTLWLHRVKLYETPNSWAECVDKLSSIN